MQLEISKMYKYDLDLIIEFRKDGRKETKDSDH